MMLTNLALLVEIALVISAIIDDSTSTRLDQPDRDVGGGDHRRRGHQLDLRIASNDSERGGISF